MYDIVQILLLILIIISVEYFISYLLNNSKFFDIKQTGGSLSAPRLYLFYSRNSIKSIKLRCGPKSIYDNQPNNKPLTTSNWGRIYYKYKQNGLFKVREFDINRSKYLKLVKRYNITKVPIILIIKNSGDVAVMNSNFNYHSISKFVNNNL